MSKKITYNYIPNSYMYNTGLSPCSKVVSESRVQNNNLVVREKKFPLIDIVNFISD